MIHFLKNKVTDSGTVWTSREGRTDLDGLIRHRFVRPVESHTTVEVTAKKQHDHKWSEQSNH